MKTKSLKWLKSYSKPRKVSEHASNFPGFSGKIKGIVSEKNGKEVEGIIYTVLIPLKTS